MSWTFRSRLVETFQSNYEIDLADKKKLILSYRECLYCILSLILPSRADFLHHTSTKLLQMWGPICTDRVKMKILCTVRGVMPWTTDCILSKMPLFYSGWSKLREQIVISCISYILMACQMHLKLVLISMKLTRRVLTSTARRRTLLVVTEKAPRGL